VAEVRGKEREESIAASELRRLLPKFIADRLSKAPVLRRTLDYFTHIPRNAVTETKVPHMFPNRGRFLIKDFELSTKFPFAFFRHRRRLPARETELIVLPKIEPLPSDIDDIPLDLGQLLVHRRGSGQDLLSLREYLPNDDLRSVDWKATARSRGLIVREFAAEDDRKVTVVLDRRMPASDEKIRTLREKIEVEQDGETALVSERFEKAIKLAASLLFHFAEQQAEVRLIIDSDSGEFGVGNRHLVEILRRLSMLDPLFETAVDASPLDSMLAEIIESEELSHNFVVSTLTENNLSPEVNQKTHLLSY
jgi:uncharacterized protein (DUF58 family)